MINIVGVIYITRTSVGRVAAFYARRLGETTQPVWVNAVGQGDVASLSTSGVSSVGAYLATR
jgi:hypothetical protein